MAQQGSDYPAVVQAQQMDPEEPVYVRTKKQTKKKPKASRHIELMEWLPTLPQLFAYMGFTQFLIMFWVFIGECADDIDGTWNLVMMWLMVSASTILFGLYQYLFKFNVLKSISRSTAAFLIFVFMMFLPSMLHSGSVAAKGIFALVKFIVIAGITVFYVAVYFDDIAPPAKNVPRRVRRVLYKQRSWLGLVVTGSLLKITVIVMTCLFFVYNFLLAKKHILRSVTATIFAFTLFIFMFLFPISHPEHDNYISSHSNRAVLFFFRMLVVAVAVVIYCIAYIEDLKSGPVQTERVVVVTETTIENVEAK